MAGLENAIGYRKLVSEIGLIGGGRVALRKILGQSNATGSRHPVTAISLKHYEHPLFLRASTSDLLVMRQIFIDKEYEEASADHARQLRSHYDSLVAKRETPVILDCGANIGLSAVWYACRFPGATVVAIEPEAGNFSLLLQNTRNYPNILAVNAAISSRTARITLSNTSDAPWAWETSVSSAGDIEALTVEDALGRVPGGIPLIAKIDIEGFETDLFGSECEWVERFPMIVFEHHDWLFAWKGTAHCILSALIASGPRDYLQRNENIFSYSHALLKP